MTDKMNQRPLPAIPLRWVTNDVKGAEYAFRSNNAQGFTYSGAPVSTDFPTSFETLAPYTTQVLDQAALLESAGLEIKLVEIKSGKVKVWYVDPATGVPCHNVHTKKVK